MNWKYVAVIIVSTFLGIYLVLATTILNQSKDLNVVCQEVHVTIEKGIIDGYLTPAEVKKLLAASNCNPVGKPIGQVNTRAIEDMLRSKELIESAECYKAQNGNVCINVKERIPVIHVMALSGEDYYVDASGMQISHPDYVCNLMIATGHISRLYAKSVLAPLGKTIMSDSFWRNQIVQVNILPDGTVELIPRIGNHVLYLGKAEQISRKLERLRKFYMYGLNKAGWNQYERISVELGNQIICKKKQ